MPGPGDGPAPADDVPDAWPLAELRQWHWMLTTHLPEPPAAEVVPVPDDEVTRLLDLVAPDSHSRPGDPRDRAVAGDP
jgi:hypothetical protein